MNLGREQRTFRTTTNSTLLSGDMITEEALPTYQALINGT
jgi:hypothetical protein